MDERDDLDRAIREERDRVADLLLTHVVRGLSEVSFELAALRQDSGGDDLAAQRLERVAERVDHLIRDTRRLAFGHVSRDPRPRADGRPVGGPTARLAPLAVHVTSARSA